MLEKCKLIERTFRLLKQRENICFCDKKYSDEFLRAHINTDLISNNNYFKVDQNKALKYRNAPKEENDPNDNL